MRARSNAIYSKQNPYKKVNNELVHTGHTPKRSTRIIPDDITNFFDDFGPMTHSHSKDSFSGDYHPHDDHSADASTANTSLNDVRSRETSRTSSEDLHEGELKTSKLLRGMVIGPKDETRINFINLLYPEASEESSSISNDQIFDLMTRKIEKDTLVERYHFWLKAAGEWQRRHNALMNVYYSTCSVFFLIYNEDSRESFENIIQEIRTIKEANSRKEVFLVLVRQESAGKSEVNFKDVQELKENNGIQMILNIDGSSEKLKYLRELIESRMN